MSAAVLSDPAASQFLRRYPNAPVLADVRVAEGMKQIYGTGTYVSAVLTSRPEWLRQNPATARRLARAVNRSLAWIHGQSFEEITRQTPERLRGSDPVVFSDSLRAAIPSFPPDGRFEETAVDSVFKVLAVSIPAATLARVDRSKTFTNEFVSGK